jgi:hypothetical protein
VWPLPVADVRFILFTFHGYSGVNRKEVLDLADLDQELEKCRSVLANRLGINEVPDAVWGYVVRLGFVYDAIIHSDYEELVKEAKARLKGLREESPHSSSNPPGCENRIVRAEAEVALSDQTRKRGQVFEEVAAALAADHPDVRRYRNTYVPNCLLSRDEAGTYLEENGSAVEDLGRVAEKLTKAYRWREGDAKWFVLTGDIPLVLPLTVTVSETVSIQDFHPNTARIIITSEPWVPVDEIKSVYQVVQRQILGGDCRPKDDRTLDAVRFVARQMRAYGNEPWTKLTERWNRVQGDPKRRYKSRGGLLQAFERFVHPIYNPVRWRPYKPTPYQAWENEQRHKLYEHAKAFGP